MSPTTSVKTLYQMLLDLGPITSQQATALFSVVEIQDPVPSIESTTETVVPLFFSKRTKASVIARITEQINTLKEKRRIIDSQLQVLEDSRAAAISSVTGRNPVERTTTITPTSVIEPARLSITPTVFGYAETVSDKRLPME
jgi:hypothetical protein